MEATVSCVFGPLLSVASHTNSKLACFRFFVMENGNLWYHRTEQEHLEKKSPLKGHSIDLCNSTIRMAQRKALDVPWDRRE